VGGAEAAPPQDIERDLRKGSRLAIDGRLEWREWETSEQKRQAVSIVADSVQFLGGAAKALTTNGEPPSEPAAKETTA
jgi:single-strand DNA-binding protein